MTGEKLLSAVEKLVEDSDELIARVERYKRSAPADESAQRAAVASRLIDTYANRSAVAGALTALPAVVPGAGTVVAAIGGAFLDIGLLLKHEVEMALSLTYLYGYDIRDREERRLSYLLASVNTYDAHAGRNFFVDVAEAEMEAIYHYTPQQVTKLLVALMSKLAVRRVVTRGFRRLIPLVGIALCGSLNRMFTAEVGRRCHAVLSQRRRVDASGRATVVEAVVDAEPRG